MASMGLVRTRANPVIFAKFQQNQSVFVTLHLTRMV
jgi:hypothetical protein